MNNPMNKLITLLLVVGLCVLESCDKEKEEIKTYSFKDQLMAGKIDGQVWIYQDGIAESTTVGIARTLSFSLFLNQPSGQGCNATFPVSGSQVSFLLLDVLGLYIINKTSPYSLDGSTSLTMTTSSGEMLFAKRGAIEITNVSSTSVSGRIDAYADDNNYINGNFEVLICK